MSVVKGVSQHVGSTKLEAKVDLKGWASLNGGTSGVNIVSNASASTRS